VDDWPLGPYGRSRFVTIFARCIRVALPKSNAMSTAPDRFVYFRFDFNRLDKNKRLYLAKPIVINDELVVLDVAIVVRCTTSESESSSPSSTGRRATLGSRRLIINRQKWKDATDDHVGSTFDSTLSLVL
jgi:hypothetical protein